MVKWMQQRPLSLMLCALLMMCMTLSSCETLRKKFTRQKKNAQNENSDFNPVLEPQDYPAPEYNALGLYKDHYSLVKVWYNDLASGINEKSDTDSKVKYAIKQINVNLDAMGALLSKDKQPTIAMLHALLKNYTSALDLPRASRNKSLIQSDLREFDRKFRRELRINAIKKDLIKIEPPH